METVPLAGVQIEAGDTNVCECPLCRDRRQHPVSAMSWDDMAMLYAPGLQAGLVSAARGHGRPAHSHTNLVRWYGADLRRRVDALGSGVFGAIPAPGIRAVVADWLTAPRNPVPWTAGCAGGALPEHHARPSGDLVDGAWR